MKSLIEKDLLKIFEAGKKCMLEHPDDDSYDDVHFNNSLNELSPELSKLIFESRKPAEVKEAEIYVAQCDSDHGFMGSPEYYRKKEIISSYYEPIHKQRKEQEERENYERLKIKFEK